MEKRYNKLYVGIVNDNNYIKINKIHDLNKIDDDFILMSRIQYNNFTIDDLQKLVNIIKSTNVKFIPGRDEFLFLKTIKNDTNYIFFVDWIFSHKNYVDYLLVNNMKFVITNGAILPEYKTLSELKLQDIDWHHKYNGRFGYAISQHKYPKKEIIFFGYSVSINTSGNDLILHEINGSNFKNTIKL